MIRIKRLFHNMASVKDYQVEDALSKEKGITLQLQGTNEIMTIPYEELKKRDYRRNGFIFTSIYDNRHYQLYDFIWNPDQVSS